jgi:hypothetical protein
MDKFCRKEDRGFITADSAQGMCTLPWPPFRGKFMTCSPTGGEGGKGHRGVAAMTGARGVGGTDQGWPKSQVEKKVPAVGVQ